MTTPLPASRHRHPGVLGALIIVVATFGLWVFAACAELFWYDQHGSRFVILALASLPTCAALLWVMTRRLRAADAMSPWLLVLAAVLGGFVALIIPSLVEPPWTIWVVDTLRLPLLRPVIAGPLEETVKLAVVVVVLRWVQVRSARTGLFVGGAVGLGYALFENIDYALDATARGGYAISPLDHFGLMLRVAIERGVFTPFAHPLWTALAAAALVVGSQGGRLRISRIAVGGWALVVVLHSLWDDLPQLLSSGVQSAPLLGLVAQFGVAVVLSGVGFVIWLVVSRRANRLPTDADAIARTTVTSAG